MITIVRVVNWDRYQGLVGESAHPVNGRQRGLLGELVGELVGAPAHHKNKKEEEAKDLSCRTGCDEPPTKETKAEYPAAFEEFWNAYPKRDGRRNGKGKSLKLWMRIPADDRPLVQQAAEIFSRSRLALDNKARDPERFLKDDWWRGWLDEPAASVLAEPSMYRDIAPRRRAAEPSANGSHA
jgi:hypothetical protein